MKLNEETKIKLRQLIEEETKKVPSEVRIELDTELLDELIFYHGKFKHDGRYFKAPIWTGDFLSKIDLSHLSFENVCLYDLSDEERPKISDETVKELNSNNGFPFVDRTLSKNNNLHVKPYIIFRNTNINIHFDDAIDDYMCGWDLSGVDLSKSSIDKLKHIDSCNLSNTNLSIDSFLNLKQFELDPKELELLDIFENLDIYDTDLSNNNLADLNINIFNMMNEDKGNGETFYNINFANTGVKIIIPNVDDLSEENISIIQKKINKGHLNGCYINGILIDNNSKIEDILRKIILQKEKEQELISNVLTSIENQISDANKTSKYI